MLFRLSASLREVDDAPLGWSDRLLVLDTIGGQRDLVLEQAELRSCFLYSPAILFTLEWSNAAFPLLHRGRLFTPCHLLWGSGLDTQHPGWAPWRPEMGCSMIISQQDDETGRGTALGLLDSFLPPLLPPPPDLPSHFLQHGLPWTRLSGGQLSWCSFWSARDLCQICWCAFLTVR